MSMKHFALAIFSLHLFVASVCLMPDHSEATSLLPHDHHVIAVNDASNCPDCHSEESDSSDHDQSPCAGAQCISQAVQPQKINIEAPVLTIGIAPPSSALSFVQSNVDAQEIETRAPLVVFLENTTVLRL